MEINPIHFPLSQLLLAFTLKPKSASFSTSSQPTWGALHTSTSSSKVERLRCSPILYIFPSFSIPLFILYFISFYCTYVSPLYHLNVGISLFQHPPPSLRYETVCLRLQTLLIYRLRIFFFRYAKFSSFFLSVQTKKNQILLTQNLNFLTFLLFFINS